MILGTHSTDPQKESTTPTFEPNTDRLHCEFVLIFDSLIGKPRFFIASGVEETQHSQDWLRQSYEINTRGRWCTPGVSFDRRTTPLTENTDTGVLLRVIRQHIHFILQTVILSVYEDLMINRSPKRINDTNL